MTLLPHLFRMLSLLASASWNLATEDPWGFAGKLAERIRQSNGPVLSLLPTEPLTRLAAAPTSKARQLIDTGHFTAGIQHVAELGSAASRSDIHLAKRTLERLEQLTTRPPTVTHISRSTDEHRVLHVLTNSKPFTQSGYTVRSHNVLTCQQEAGIQVEAVTRLAYPVLVGKFPTSATQVVDDIAYHRMLPWSYPAGLRKRDTLAVRDLVGRAHHFRATVLHTTTDYKNAVIVARAAAELDIPWVYEVRGELENTWLSRQPVDKQTEAEASEFYNLARSQEARYMQAADAVVALSEVSRDQLVERGVRPGKIHVIPNAVESDLVGRDFDRSAIRRELGLDPEVTLVGTVTSVVDYEGLEVLIRALKHLPHKVSALIVGDGTARPRLESLAHQLGLEQRVIFTGRQPQKSIWRWYAALNVFVVPRRDIPVTRTVTPLKPLTAQALGIPVVASDLPALREVTGGLARYVAPDDSEALAEALASLDPSGRKQEGNEEWLTGRTWAANGERYRMLYDSLVAR
ncbi:glycosyltransferase [Corynebacterium maris DSM 45190]|uniref:Glycosyltransferase n=1 Tax=Corynebacterium maris DSM 45190 TaxID=1224163 RepID=S5SVY6_9CORY|nr:glycosyltransferase [Corynebacterium maris]AGS35384.1 glycosyltransferase [Corynebacterium maris DSM 45190]